MNNTSIAYLTGLIEGDGHVSLFNHKNGRGESYQDIRVVFAQSEKNNGLEVCNYLRSCVGGTITYHKRARPGWSNMYYWTLCGKKALELCRKMLPLSIIKRKQITKALADYHGKRL